MLVVALTIFRQQVGYKASYKNQLYPEIIFITDPDKMFIGPIIDP